MSKSVIKTLTILATLGSMLLYIPVNRFVSGGSSLEVPLDKFIPLIPVFVIPYLFGLLFWIGTIIYVNLKKTGVLAVRLNFMVILSGILSVLIYIFLPTFVNRPAITGSDIFSWILSLVYANDRIYNAAPSGHTFYTVICFLTLWKAVPKYRVLWALISLLIIASTVFTKQHNIMDVFFGLVFVVAIYLLAHLKK